MGYLYVGYVHALTILKERVTERVSRMYQGTTYIYNTQDDVSDGRVFILE